MNLIGSIKNFVEEKQGFDTKLYIFIVNLEKVWNGFKPIAKKRIDKFRDFLTKVLGKTPLEPINGKIKIKLYRKWNSFPDPYGKRKSYYAGRSKDVKKLKNWIFYSDGGSVLVRGFRGIGKTAFVYHVISRLYKIENRLFWKKKKLFIPVNFSEGFKIEGDEIPSEKLQLLQKLIISAKEADSNSLKSLKIDDLYNLAISSKAEVENLHVVSRKNTFGVEVKLLAADVLLITYAAGLFQKKFSYLLPDYLQDPKLLAFIPAISFIFIFGIIYSFTKKQSKITKTLLNSSNYLGLKFKEKLNKENVIPIFVIDELDKLFKSKIKGQEKAVGIKEVNKLVRKLKYLFTLSRARFIFIVNEEYPHWKGQSLSGRPEQATYFNWDIFLAGITLKDIEKYFNKIKRKKLGENGKKLLEEFIHYISFESKRVFSEVNQLLRDFIEYKNGDPYLVIIKLDDTSMRKAVMENILDSVLTLEGELEFTLKQREFYHKTYLILRKVAEDVKENKFKSGGGFSSLSIRGLIDKYGEQDSPDFVCELTQLQKERIVLKIKDFFVSLQKNAFSADEKGIFFEEESSVDTPIEATLSFENVDIGGLPKTLFPRLPEESLEFKKIVGEFKRVINKLKRGLIIKMMLWWQFQCLEMLVSIF